MPEDPVPGSRVRTTTKHGVLTVDEIASMLPGMSRLMDELAGTENRIAIERKRYNEGVLRFNQLIRKFPVNLIAQSFDFQKGVYFEAPESKQEVPKVEFK